MLRAFSLGALGRLCLCGAIKEPVWESVWEDQIVDCAQYVEGAAKPSNNVRLRLLLQHGCGIDSTDGLTAKTKGLSALAVASKFGNFEGVELLADAGADLEFEALRATPLYLAASEGHSNVVEALLARGAKVGGAPGGQVPLHAAAQHGSVACVRKLLAAGPDVDRHVLGGTALMIAAQRGHVAVVKALIAHGANVRLRSDDGLTAEDAAARGGMKRCAAALRAVATPPRAAEGCVGLVESAGDEADVAILKRLLARGCAVDAPSQAADSRRGFTALCVAASFGNVAAIEVLLDAGAAVDRVLGAGPFINLSPIMFAGQFGQVGAIALLAKRGADVNMHDISGATALTMATASGHVDAVVALAGLGANVDQAANRLPALCFAAKEGDVGMVKALIALGAKIGATAPDGANALHFAAQHGQAAVARALLESGAHADKRVRAGGTALHFAAQHGSADVAAALLEGGADPHILDFEGRTAADIVKKKGGEIVAVLRWYATRPHAAPAASTASEEIYAALLWLLLSAGAVAALAHARGRWRWRLALGDFVLMASPQLLLAVIAKTAGSDSHGFFGAMAFATLNLCSTLATARRAPPRGRAFLALLLGPYALALAFPKGLEGYVKYFIGLEPFDVSSLEVSQLLLPRACITATLGAANAAWAQFWTQGEAAPGAVHTPAPRQRAPPKAKAPAPRQRAPPKAKARKDPPAKAPRCRRRVAEREAPQTMADDDDEAAEPRSNVTSDDDAAHVPLADDDEAAASESCAPRSDSGVEERKAASDDEEGKAASDDEAARPTTAAASDDDDDDGGNTVHLRALGLDASLLALFRLHEIDDYALPLLEAADLSDLGIPLSTALQILSAVRCQRKSKQLSVDLILENAAQHQAVLERELLDHREVLSRIRIASRVVNEDWLCPISCEVMKDPVVARDDQTYERVCIEQWFATGSETSPVTGVKLASLDLVRNTLVRKMISAFLEECRRDVNDSC
ncbi:ankyrin repeat-containing domain protein [Pelagophyceae sp. CCMP2097]|nr:ankyrin repeat-containing domain protein [Pelagophyceae sp. CCMP2097]